MDSIAHCLRKCKTETEIRVGMRQSCFWKGKIPLSAYADIPLFKGDILKIDLRAFRFPIAQPAHIFMKPYQCFPAPYFSIYQHSIFVDFLQAFFSFSTHFYTARIKATSVFVQFF